MGEPIVNPENRGDAPGGAGPLENTGHTEATDKNQPDQHVEAPPGNSLSEKDPLIISKEDSANLEEVRKGLEFDRKGNFALTPAIAGGPSVEDDSKSQHILNAQIPGIPVEEERSGGRTGGVTGGRNPFGGIKGRIAAAVVVLGGLLGGGAAYVANQSSANTGEPNHGGAPTVPVNPEKTHSGVATSEPTTIPTIATTETPTATPEPTKVPDPEGSHGKYKTVAEMPVSETDKVTIKELLGDSEAFIITDNAVTAIENPLKTRTQCPERIGVENSPMKLCASMDGIKFNTEGDPNSSEREGRAIRKGKYYIWEKDAKSGKTFEQYEQERKSGIKHPYIVKAYNLDSGKIEDISVQDENKPWVIRFVSQPDDVFFEVTIGQGYSYTVKNGIVRMDIYTEDPIGYGIPGSDLSETYQGASMVARGLVNQADPYLRQQILDGKTPYRQPLGVAQTTMKPFMDGVNEELVIETKQEGPYTLKDTIYRQNGKYNHKEIFRNNYLP